MKILLLVLIVLLTSCSSESPVDSSIEIVENYYESLISRDLDKQMEVLEVFSVDKEDYWDSFLSHVQGGELYELSLHYEDQLLIMIKLDFELVLDQDFPANPSFKPGENRVERYFSFFKNDDYKLKEILNKAIY